MRGERNDRLFPTAHAKEEFRERWIRACFRINQEIEKERHAQSEKSIRTSSHSRLFVAKKDH